MSANKENQEAEEQAELQSAASPRLSSTGEQEDQGGPARPSHPALQGYQHSSWNDHLHYPFQGHQHRPPADARSIASSAAADRDDKSIYELETGALDAHTEEGEEEEEDGDPREEEEEEEEEEPVEISLTQVQEDGLHSVQLRSDSSNVASTFAGISGPASLADVVEQLADQAVAGELSPRQAAAAIRTATQQRNGGHGAGSSRAVTGEATSPSIAAADAGTDAASALSIDGSDAASVSASGAGHSSIARSDDFWQQGGGAGGAGTSVGADAGTGGSSAAEADMMESVSLDPEGAGEGEPAAPAAEVAAGRAQGAPAAAPDVQPARASGQSAEAGAEEGDAASGGAAEAAAAERQAGVAAAGVDAAGAGDVPRTTSNYKSQLMQTLTATVSEEDITVYSAAGADAAAELAALQGTAAPPQAQQQQPGTVAAAGATAQPLSDGMVPAAAGQVARLEPLSVEGGPESSGTMSTGETARALAAINAAGGSGQAVSSIGSEELQLKEQPALPFPQAWYEKFYGLLYMDGVDALGRPVVVLNVDAVPSNMKSNALVFAKVHLEPLVNQGDYVLVVTSRGHAKLPSMWVMYAYRSLPRPFRKNVQHIVLVRPSAFLRTVVAFMRSFVSKKAGRKIKQVQSVHDIAAATDGEVTVQSLGAAFAADLAAAEEAAALAANGGDASP